VAARRSREAPERNRYIWRDPGPGGATPNNWVSNFGGPAWTLDPASGQYYLHLFLPQQPDLNWREPAVHAAFEGMLAFWAAHGVDGFRVDVAHMLYKHPDLLDNPLLPAPANEPGSVAAWNRFEHRYDLDQPEVVDVYRRWRQVLGADGPLLLGEVFLLDARKVARFLTGDGLDAAFWFGTLTAPWDRDALLRALQAGQGSLGRGAAWPTGNHDVRRATSRFGGGPSGARRAAALTALLVALPGMTFIFNGDELGLPDADVPPDAADDPIAVCAGEHALARDVARTPMPWQPGPGLGFTSAARAWLPDGGRAARDTVAVQRKDAGSVLHVYHRILHFAKNRPRWQDAAPVWSTAGDLIRFARGPLVAALNATASPQELRLPAPPAHVLSTREVDPPPSRSLVLEPDEAILALNA
jgi:alpha-glucosidase